jgi:nucleoside-diphosphate-sugar epimerase
MADALIGHTGFVGSTLLRQRSFSGLYRSVDIETISGKKFDTIVCAGAPGQKWLANKEPDNDRASIDKLTKAVSEARCERFILVSTVDVFKTPVEVDERTAVDTEGLHAYGLHRFQLEESVRRFFPNALIVRLPGLVGPGLRKNALFDLHNDNNVAAIDSRAAFQFYPMVNLWSDIERALERNMKLVHLTAEPLVMAEVAREAFGRTFENAKCGDAARYDFRTTHAGAFSGVGAYTYSARESLLAIRAYAQSEPKNVKR